MQKIVLILVGALLPMLQYGQIIADHTVVDNFDDIPQFYIDQVRKMWLTVPGESHSEAYRVGLTLLETLDARFQVKVIESGVPEGYTDQHLRVSRAMYVGGWLYNYGEEDWFTNSTGIGYTKGSIDYCNSNNLEIAAIGFGWCWDDTYNDPSKSVDPVYGCRWYGGSMGGPEGPLPWGLDSDDYFITGNSICMDTYLNVTQGYSDYCKLKGYKTKMFFTTGPVETYYTPGEAGYQGSIKHKYIREFVKKDPMRILFDYADILCWDDNGIQTTVTWNSHTFPIITTKNLGDGSIGHIGSAGAIRLAKAIWWMLARIAGWDGVSTDMNESLVKEHGAIKKIVTSDEIKMLLCDNLIYRNAELFDFQGKAILNKVIENNVLSFDISSLPTGVYFVVLSSGDKRVVEKVIKH